MPSSVRPKKITPPYTTMNLQRPSIIVGDAEIEPGTSAPVVWRATNEPPHLQNIINWRSKVAKSLRNSKRKKGKIQYTRTKKMPFIDRININNYLFVQTCYFLYFFWVCLYIHTWSLRICLRFDYVAFFHCKFVSVGCLIYLPTLPKLCPFFGTVILLCVKLNMLAKMLE